MVVEAVGCEPLSGVGFPANKELSGKIVGIRLSRETRAVDRSLCVGDEFPAS